YGLVCSCSPRPRINSWPAHRDNFLPPLPGQEQEADERTESVTAVLGFFPHCPELVVGKNARTRLAMKFARHAGRHRTAVVFIATHIPTRHCRECYEQILGGAAPMLLSGLVGEVCEFVTFDTGEFTAAELAFDHVEVSMWFA